MDRNSYQNVFDQVHLSAQRASQIRRELAGRTQDRLEDVNMMNDKRTRRPAAVLAAVGAVAALTVTAFASGGEMLDRVFQMMTGSTITQSVGADGNYYLDSSGEQTEPVSPVELREDGRLYLTINGEDRDITEECSYETPYIYECTGDDGLRHTFIIGGEPEEIGWVEYACSEDSDVAFSGTALSVNADGASLSTLPWLNKGLEQATGVSLERLPWNVSQILDDGTGEYETETWTVRWQTDGDDVGIEDESKVTQVTKVSIINNQD